MFLRDTSHLCVFPVLSCLNEKFSYKFFSPQILICHWKYFPSYNYKRELAKYACTYSHFHRYFSQLDIWLVNKWNNASIVSSRKNARISTPAYLHESWSLKTLCMLLKCTQSNFWALQPTHNCIEVNWSNLNSLQTETHT